MNVTVWRPIAEADPDQAQEYLVRGGFVLDASHIFPEWIAFSGCALVSWCNQRGISGWRGEQTELYDAFLWHKPTHFIDTADLLALALALALASDGEKQ